MGSGENTANTALVTSTEQDSDPPKSLAVQPIIQSNVIAFPFRNQSIPIHIQEQADRIESMHVDMFERIADDLLERTLSAIEAAGFDPSFDQVRGREIENDSSLIYESIVSLMCRIMGYKHMLHEHADQWALDGILPQVIDQSAEEG